MPSLLCSESIPSPGVVDAAAVVVANEGSTVGDELPTRRPPTIEPWPGSAWLMLTGGAIVAVCTVVVLDDASVSAAAHWNLRTIGATADSATMLTTANAIRLVFILYLFKTFLIKNCFSYKCTNWVGLLSV